MGVLEGLNPQQQEAATHFEGPLLILAGAGSGKTRVLTNRIAWLIDEKGVNPWNIMAITFTNKAAGEMRDRVDRMVAFGAESIWVSTFHSSCARILRRHIDLMDYDTHFAIYDTDDQKSVMKEILKHESSEISKYKERFFMSAISHCKDEMISPEDFLKAANGDPTGQMIARIYRKYQNELHKNNALDFDDLLYITVRLFEQHPEVLAYYQDRFQFIMVDEYQDTNTAQFELIRLLSQRHRNLCVVGDDDQSIYKFRGANIRNILEFEETFPNTKVIRLEQNYRSTKRILEVANAVIANNEGRKQKRLWTENPEGDPVRYRTFMSGYEEAEYIASDIQSKKLLGEFNYEDTAILYRTNAQSRLLEEKLLMQGVPYRIVGGINFYARKEIKDLLAYLRTVANENDDLAIHRIINIPRRGIGETSISRVDTYAQINGLSFYQALERAREIPGIGKGASKLEAFVTFIRVLKTRAKEMKVSDLLKSIIEDTGYQKELETEGTDEAKDRIANIGELLSKVTSYEETTEKPDLNEFLEEVSLVADIDSMEDGKHAVTLMTLHSAKGLEFPNVYLAGMEEGTFPSYMSIMADDPQEEIEEERRLCYVGITRAMRQLTLTCAFTRIVRGEKRYCKESRFIEEIPPELLGSNSGTRAGNRKLSDNSGAEEESVEEFRFGSTPRTDGFRRSGAMDNPGSFYHQAPMAKTHRQEEREKTVEAFREKAIPVHTGSQVRKTAPDYQVGDRVRHIKFGEGTVQAIIDGGRDFEVTVEFDRFGVKKMFAAFAKLVRV